MSGRGAGVEVTDRAARSRRERWGLLGFVGLSLLLHAMLLLFGLNRIDGEDALPEAALEPGEIEGLGGATVPLTVAGPPTGQPLSPETETEVEVEVEAEAEVEVAPNPEASAPQRRRPASPSEGLARPASGTGDDVTEGGGRGDGDGFGTPGGAEAMVAPEPPADRCGDPVVGVWRGQRFDPRDQQWAQMTLRIRRGGGSALTGSIQSRLWRGRRDQPTPPRCTAYGEDRTWRMSATGTAEGRSFTFQGGAATMIREDCPAGPFRYFPDRFTGTVRSGGDVMDASNNDGHVAFDEDYVLRRTACD